MIDAKIGGAYVLKSSDPIPKILPLGEIGDYLKGLSVLVTPNQSSRKQKLDQLYPDNTWVWEEKDPNIIRLFEISKKRYLEGIYTDGRHVELMYLRKTQAEIEKEQKGITTNFT